MDRYINPPQKLEEERQRLQAENVRLRGAVAAGKEPPVGIVGKSHSIQQVLTIVSKVADYKSTVLLLGESGTGTPAVASSPVDWAALTHNNAGSAPFPAGSR
jgi:transcriptional regulator with GAF, ATPase, and Fis domain